MRVDREGEIKGIGFGDGSGRKIIYPVVVNQDLSGMNLFNVRYATHPEKGVWRYYEVSAGKDWYNLYGYYPVITEVDYINDNDENWEAGRFNEGFESGVSLVSYVDPRPGVVQDMGGSVNVFTGDVYDGIMSLSILLQCKFDKLALLVKLSHILYAYHTLLLYTFIRLSPAAECLQRD